MSSRAITVTLLTVIALVSLMPVIAKASFTQNGVTVYSPPYQGYTYQTNQTVTLNISAPSYPNALVTVNVYNPGDKLIFTNVYQTDSSGKLAVQLFTVPEATPQYVSAGWINGTYTIVVLVGTSTGVNIQVNLVVLPPPQLKVTSITLTVNSQIPYAINGTTYTGSRTFSFNAPVTVSFENPYVSQPGEVRYLVTAVNVNGQTVQGNSVTISASGTYTVSPVYVVQYNVSFPFPLKVNINNTNLTGSWFWVNQGQKITVYQQTVYLGQGVAYTVTPQTIVVSSPGRVNISYEKAYQLNFSEPVNVTINGATEVGKSFWVPAGATVNVNSYLYPNSTVRIPVNVSPSSFQVNGPTSVAVSYGKPEYLVAVPFNGVVYEAWVSEGSQPPSVIQVSDYERLALKSPIEVTSPILDASGYYVIQYRVDLNNNVTWMDRGSTLYLSAGNNPILAFFTPTYWQGNYTGPGGVELLVYGPISESSYTGLNVFNVLLVILAILVVILAILLVRKPRTQGVVTQGSSEAPPQPPTQVQAYPRSTQEQPTTQPPAQAAQQPTAQPQTQVQAPPPPQPQAPQSAPLTVKEEKPGTLNQQGVATLYLSVNKPAIITRAVLKSTNAQEAFNVPIQLNPGSNQVILQFGAVQNFLKFVRYDIEMTLVDPQTNAAQRVVVSAYGV
ncbi:MAG: DUF973 family protein [Sulfolobales archaeon]|nr:DUF973 family protein [Sulfolobales archaeon]